MASAVMDSFLYHFNQQEKVLNSVLWVSLTSLFILQNLGNAWFFAILFLLHSVRSAFILLQKGKTNETMTYIPWLKDIMASLIIMCWQQYL